MMMKGNAYLFRGREGSGGGRQQRKGYSYRVMLVWEWLLGQSLSYGRG